MIAELVKYILFMCLSGGSCLLSILYYAQFSKRWTNQKMRWKDFYLNPGVIYLHFSLAFLLIVLFV